ncbi:MAG TPA: M28 family peptidase [Rectinemataceae bacterium]|nr:M28 family peptidase [Rectinemataceae bacterium]
MSFGQDFHAFLAPGADRLVRLSGMLARRSLEGKVLAIGGRRHLLVRLSSGAPTTILVAHYDRVEGSPGALDNSAACLVLAEAGARIFRDPQALEGVFLLFTDGEEAPSTGSPLSQGAYALATGLRKVFGRARPSIYIFDVLGRGGRLLLSTASRRVAEGQRALLDAMESRAFAAATAANLAAPRRLPLPWSDDLGFTLAGMPSVAISLLPEAEAVLLERGLASCDPSATDRFPGREGLGKAWPPTWDILHSPEDGPELIEKIAMEKMGDFCLSLCRTCGVASTFL